MIFYPRFGVTENVGVETWHQIAALENVGVSDSDQ